MSFVLPPFPGSLIPRYGNYGGRYWTGGQYNGTDFSVLPRNALDNAFRNHDLAYQSTDPFLRGAADFRLQLEVIQLWRAGEFENYSAYDKAYAFSVYLYFPLQAVGGPFVSLPSLLRDAISPIFRDPLVIDLDGGGVEVSALGEAGQAGASTVFFDYDRDGFAERTGWVKPDDGMLAFDANENGLVDGISELFGSPSQDGFEVLETLDSNGDGIINASDAQFAKLRVWRDLNSNGVTDSGELTTLAESGIASISLARTDVLGTNEGNQLGFEAIVNRTDGTNTIGQTVYFATDRRDTQDSTPGFVPSEGVEFLPQLPGSGQINSIAWKATQDAGFRADWTALTDEATALSPDQLRWRLEALLLRWAGVDGINEDSRGSYVDARHLSFVEKFFGETYREIRFGEESATSPTTEALGLGIEGTFAQLVDIIQLTFLTQIVPSVAARGGDVGAALTSPYLPYLVLDFRNEIPEGEEAPETPGNLGSVVDFVKSMAPSDVSEAIGYYTRALAPLRAMAATAFDGSMEAYGIFMASRFEDDRPASKNCRARTGEGYGLRWRSRRERRSRY
jgi:hypothetical protein